MGSTKFVLLAVCVFSVTKAEEGYLRENPIRQLTYDHGYGDANMENIQNDLLNNMDGIPGETRKDYPTFHLMPKTEFDCDEQLFPGYYADPEANCQLYHICQPGGRKDSFLCPNGTLFNQERLVCEWWHIVDCSQARAKYSVNEAITKAMEEVDRKVAERKASEAFLYKSSNLVRSEVHDAQQPPQGFKSNNNFNFEKEGSTYKNTFASNYYDKKETLEQPSSLKKDHVMETKFEYLSSLNDNVPIKTYLPAQ